MESFTFKEKLDIIIQLAKEKKAEDIITLDVKEVSNITDRLVICSGEGSIHTRTIGKYILKEIKKMGIKFHHTEGLEHGSWILLDFMNIVVHIFDKKTRDYYKLEDFWKEMIKQDITNSEKE